MTVVSDVNYYREPVQVMEESRPMGTFWLVEQEECCSGLVIL